jgi:uncharacterized membrane protein YccC
MPARTDRGPVRSAVQSALVVDRSAIVPVTGAVTAVSVVVLFALGLARAAPATTSGLALGALFVGLAARIAGPRLAASALLGDAVGLAVSAFVGCATAGAPWLHAVALVAWCFAGGFAVVLGPARSTVGIQAVMAIVIFGRAPESLRSSTTIAVAVLLGGALQTAVQVVVRLPAGLGPQRALTAQAFCELAAAARDGVVRRGAAVASTVDRGVRELGSNGGLVRSDSQALRGLLDEARRMRLELIGFDGLAARLDPDGPTARTVAAVRASFAEALEQVAGWTAPDAVAARRREGLRPPAEFERALGDLRDGTDPDAAADELRPGLVAHVEALAGQLRASFRLVGQVTGSARLTFRPTGRSRRRAIGSAAPIRRTLAGQLTWSSAAFRHAVRLAVVVPALDVSLQQSGLARSYWVPLSAAVVLRPDFASTMARGVARVAGSALGVGVIGAIVGGLHPSTTWLVLLVTVTSWGTFTFTQANYAIGVVFLTGLVLLLAGAGHVATLAIAAERLVDSVVGGSVALLAYLAWPTWSTTAVPQALAHLVGAARRYLVPVFTALGSGTAPDPDRMLEAGAALRRSLVDADAAVGRSVAEPSSRRADPTASGGVLEALRRLAWAAHGIRTELPLPPMPGSGAYATALDVCLADLESRLAGEPARDAPPMLRPAFLRLEADCRSDRRLSAALVQLDELTNSVDTADELAGRGTLGTDG